MKHSTLFFALSMALTVTVVGTTIRAQVNRPAGRLTAAECPLSDSPEAAQSTCVTVLIKQGATGQGPAAYGVNPLNVAPGTTVFWFNQDSVDHTVTANDGSFDSGTLTPGAEFSHQFNDSGSYPYYCAIHGQESMSGTVNVGAAGAAPGPGPSASATVSPRPSLSPSPRPSLSPSPRPSISPSPRPSISPSPTASVTPSGTPSATPSATPSYSPTSTGTPTGGASGTPGATPTGTLTPLPTPTGTYTFTPLPTPTGTLTPQ